MGKPVYFWKDRPGGTVPSGAGQVIIVNCSKVVVENQSVGGGSIGILLGFSENSYASTNNIASSNFFEGIILEYSNNQHY